MIEQRCTCDVAWCDVHHARGTLSSTFATHFDPITGALVGTVRVEHDHRPSKAPGTTAAADRPCTSDCRANPPEDTPRRHTFDDRTDIEFALEAAEAAVKLAWDHPEWSAQECARHAVESETS